MLKANKTKIINFIILLVLFFIIGGARNFGADWLILKIWPLLNLLPYLYNKLFPQNENAIIYFILAVSWLYILACAIQFVYQKIKK
ncbi:MAG: hypothetical protein HOE19_01850 [Candidatus Komeilibacteria bacterium]|jgi:hypothetical protein|nr:hypothetical protein [Candidatus Komeilibacteria bacterium]MBT4447477.1 hypothetical protein [Candidatus Komeilibacteria bacterium]